MFDEVANKNIENLIKNINTHAETINKLIDAVQELNNRLKVLEENYGISND